MSLNLDKDKTALLVMDYQSAIVGMVAPADADRLPKVAAAIDAARAAGLRVIYVVIGFRSGYPEVSPANKGFSALRESKRFSPGAAGTEIHPAVGPKSGDLIVTKHRVSAFSGSDLDMLLRAGGIDTLVLAGISTSGVVLSTLRQAADLDFRIVVLKDGCMDSDPEVHACLVNKVFPRQAEISDLEAFIQSLS